MMKILVAVLMLVCAMSLNAQTVAPKSEKADAIYVNGMVWTGQKLSMADRDIIFQNAFTKGHAIAFAVKGDRFLYVGSPEDAMKLKGPHTKVVDLGGKFVMPGFNDAHAHMPGGGFAKLSVDLVGTKTLQEMVERIAARAKTVAPGEWIVGRGWDHTKWTEQVLPSRQDLDRVTGEHPAIFQRVDGHISVANSAALKAAGISRDTKAGFGSAIDHDAQGEPTGILRETPAEELVFSKIPQPTPAKRRKALELALQDAAQWGITSVQDASEVGSPEDNEHSWQDFLIYEELEKEGKLTARISNWLPFDEDLKTLEQHRAHHPQSDPMLHTGLLKAYMDGSLGSRTAAMLAPYSDDPKNSGLTRFEAARLNQMAVERAAAGFQMGFHAIGDEGTEMALDAFAAAERYVREHSPSAVASVGGARLNIEHVGVPTENFRFRVEHAQVVAPNQIGRFRELGVIASVQPNHLLTDMYWVESRVGAEREKTSYPWRQFLDAGVRLAFGTDYPVEPITPFRGIYSAVSRRSEDGRRSFQPEQALTIDEALSAYTSGAAYAEFAEKEKGMIAAGYLADFTVLDRDLTKIKPAEILGTHVLTTVVGGKVVYEAK